MISEQTPDFGLDAALAGDASYAVVKPPAVAPSLGGDSETVPGWAERAALLQRLTSSLASKTHLAEIADEVTRHCGEIFGATASLVYLRDGEALVLIGDGGIEPGRVESYRRVPLDSAIPLAVAARDRVPAFLEQREQLLAKHPELASVSRDGVPLEGMVLLPLQSTEGELIGALAFSFYAPQRIDVVRREMFLIVASQCAQALGRAALLESLERTNRDLLRQQQRLELLANVGEVLTSTLDSREALRRFVQLLVPAIADWCAIDEIVDGEIRRVAVHHTDPEKVELAARLLERYPVAVDEPTGVPNVLRTGATEWLADVPDALLVAAARDEEHLAVARSLGLVSYACVPIVARGKILGALSLVHAESGRRFTAEDVSAAEDLARRAALALENVRLYERVAGSETRMRALVEATAAIVWTARPDGEVVERSPSWLAFTGQTDAEYRDGGFLDAIHPEDRAATMERWRAATSAQTAYAAEYRLRRADGSYAHTLARGMPVRDRLGRVVEYVGCNVDVSELRDAEARARMHADALTTINEVSLRISGELDRERMVQAVTDAGTALSGAQFGAFFYNVIDPHGDRYMLYTISGVPRERFASVPMPRNTAVFAPTFAGEGIVRVADITEDPRYGKNAPHMGMPEGHLPVRSYLAAPVVLRSGEVVGGLFFGHEQVGVFDERAEMLVAGIAAQAAIAMDNSRLFEESQQLVVALESSNRDLDQFAYVASHDLKAPLRGMANLAQWIEEDLGTEIPPEVREKLELLRGRVVRMEALIQGILEYSRAGRRPQARTKPVNLGLLVDEIVDLLAPGGGAVVEHADALPTIPCNDVMMRQVLQNLIANALKHAGRPDPTIAVTSRELEREWEISVTDDGIGIAPEFHERIWGIFQTLEPRDKVEGTGIGLAIVKRIVQSWRGRVGLRSSPGAGATFFFTFPKPEGST